MHEFDVANIYKWVFKTSCAILSNTFDIVMAVFDVQQSAISSAARLIQGMATGGDPIGAVRGTVGYTVLLCFMLFKTGGIAQRIFHPTQKPVELCEYLSKTYTRPGELVADICAGSGATAVAAVNTGRRFVCFETAPAFYAAASERIRVARSAVEAGEKGV